ncbi:MAG TPA: N-acetylmuramoyl-L-alanine amidase [Candidatus Limiplasma sp.]|nr:N-acetylmuramoyl-L-alanine amidase [Candidatus Limiplasma sp.]HRX09652.1 N-acetylmuramoyl-L-alanine amidase [Candidatus Limiplasma sp.]
MKRIAALLFLVLFLSAAQADGLVVQPYTGGIAYQFQADVPFVVLECKTDTETVKQTVYAQDGNFSGNVDLLYTVDPSFVRLTVKTMDGEELFSRRGDTIAVDQAVPVQNLAPEDRCWKLTDVSITPAIHGLEYHFRAPGRASVLLEYSSSTQKGSVTLYAGDGYAYDGILELPYTYHNSNVVFTVSDIKKAVELYQDMIRTAYPVPDAAPQVAGRLSGITVCIDPGHQEEGQFITEPIGPGLEGTKRSSAGMARGTETRRMESIVVLEIAFVLRDVLLSQGATVVMTRDIQETYVSNLDRAGIAAEAGADILLRLHGNNRDETNIQGIIVYAPYGSDYARAIADADGWRVMGDLMLSAMQNATGQTKGSTALSNNYIGNNWAQMPNFLLEMGYMSNPAEDMLLSSPAYQELIAQGIADGVYALCVYRGLIAE